MGLRINTNVPALTALRNIKLAENRQSKSLERLSTGLRINRASDDPSGLAQAVDMRAQIVSLAQAVQNGENAASMLSTAEAAMSQVSEQLLKIRESLMFALNEGGITTEQLYAEQRAVDASIVAIDRVAAQTRFNGRSLLNGQSGYTLSSVGANLQDVRIYQAGFTQAYAQQSALTYYVNVVTRASQANYDTNITDGTLANSVKFQIMGTKGTETLVFLSNAALTSMIAAVNNVKESTGVYASQDGASLILLSLGYGSDQSARIQQVSGTTVAGLIGADFGVDAVAYVNGMRSGGRGLDLNVSTGNTHLGFRIASAQGAGNAGSFTVKNTALNFQLGATTNGYDSFNVGIPSIASIFLGQTARNFAGMPLEGGTLDTLRSGGINDLLSNPDNALSVVDKALDQITAMRTHVGTSEGNIIESRIRTLGVEIENLTASRSMIEDLDFAQETAEFTRNQILFQTNVSALASANVIPQSVLALIQ